MRVLITGSAGVVGTILVKGLGSRYRLRGFDIKPTPGLEDAVISDIGDKEVVLRAMEGMDAVIHLVNVGGDWASCTRNMTAIYNVLEAARHNSVNRIVYASRARMHADSVPSAVPLYTVDLPSRPKDFYSLSKVFAEHLGYMYSVKHGLEFVAVRVGNLKADRKSPSQPHHLGHADCVRCFEQAIIHPGVKFEVVYGVSRSAGLHYDLEHGLNAIAYYPEQSSE